MKVHHRIVVGRLHVQVVFHDHPFAMRTPLVFTLHLFVVIIVGEIGRQPLHPIARLEMIVHRVPQPGMHDFMPQGIGLGIASFHHPAAQQREGRQTDTAGEKIFHDRELGKGIRAEQFRVPLEIARRGLHVLTRDMRILGKDVRDDFDAIPFRRPLHEPIRRQRQGFGSDAHVPFRRCRRLVLRKRHFLPMRDRSPAGRHGRYHAKRCERPAHMRIPGGFRGQIDALFTDVSHGSVRPHEPQARRRRGLILDATTIRDSHAGFIGCGRRLREMNVDGARPSGGILFVAG